MAVHLLVGAVASDSGGGLSADFGVRLDRLVLRYAARGTFGDRSDTVFQSGRADWLFAEGAGLAGYLGGGAGEVVRHLEGVPPAYSLAATLEGGLILGSRYYMPPLVLGLEVTLPLGGGSVADAPVVSATLSFNLLFVLGVLAGLH